MRLDVVVTGTGRSGTTSVSRVLHDELGVCMGHQFHAPSAPQPEGSYEDAGLVKSSRKLAGGFTRLGMPQMSVAQWKLEWEMRHRRFGCDAEIRGVKSPHLSALTREQWLELAPRLIVRTWRPKELVVASMERWRGSGEDWGAFYDERERRMDAAFQCVPIPVVVVSFANRTSDEQIRDLLESSLRRFAA